MPIGRVASMGKPFMVRVLSRDEGMPLTSSFFCDFLFADPRFISKPLKFLEPRQISTGGFPLECHPEWEDFNQHSMEFPHLQLVDHSA